MTYRPEVDGLRAFAIIPVVLFHAGFNFFDNGYLGVDIFFVISGYLITTLIATQINNKSFSIKAFFERRARRLLPALFLVMFISIPAAFLLLQPDELENFGQSLVATSLFSNNILLILTSSDYWSIESEFKPLLHTWSLGVEEQFYLLFPFFMIFITAYNLRIFLMTSVCLISLALFYYLNQLNLSFLSFYSLPTRFWELMTGSLFAVWEVKNEKQTKKRNLIYDNSVSIIGFILLFLALTSSNIIFKIDSRFLPIIAVISTLTLIMFAHKETLIGKFLSNFWLVAIGLGSYSIYLWHQPILAFIRSISIDEPSNLLLIFGIFLALILSIFSYQIEKVFRFNNFLSSKNFAILVAAFMTLFVSVGSIFHFTSGFYNSHDELRSEFSLSTKGNKNSGYVDSAFEYLDREFTDNKKSNLLFIGDSFARDLIMMGKANNFFQTSEVSYLNFNCEELSKFKFPNNPKSIKNADLIIVSYRLLEVDDEKACLIDQLGYIKEINKTFLVVGPKDYGYNINMPFKKKDYEFKARVSDDIIEFNNFLNDLLPDQKFIDLIDLLEEEENFLPLFTPNRKLMTTDKKHFTPHGSKYAGKILFDYLELQNIYKIQ